ncbi:LOW QUALITY PROTEIN: sterol carrier protein 2 [Oryza sativa Japonica Group]|uniref:LOW QUALITY PROTEIN: sterol carrier protein 2 n=1 Tax=Oryza sativa subsp. japonica TaxID=39947 RepID=UPI000E1B9CAC|nr:LOW QUALITY PROTEIN: non-specific lipid-transfer protein [Oryza sativa Japonica Group]
MPQEHNSVSHLQSNYRNLNQKSCDAMEGSNLKSAALLEQLHVHLASGAGKELVEMIGFVYQLNISPKKLGFDEEVFIVVDLKKGVVSKGPYEGKPDATFSFTDDDFLAISSGKLNPQMVFIMGKLKIKGSISAAQKFTPDSIFPKPSKL